MVTGSPLFRKLLRDMRENAMQFLAMILLPAEVGKG